MPDNIGGWTTGQLMRFVVNELRTHPPSFFKSLRLSDLRAVKKLVVEDELELSQRAIKYLRDTLRTELELVDPDDGWTAPSLNSPWGNYTTTFGSDYQLAGYRKLASGLVVLKGLVYTSSGSIANPIFTLPAGYRPAHILLGFGYSAVGAARLDVMTNGTIQCQSAIGVNGWVSLENIRFYAEQ